MFLFVYRMDWLASSIRMHAGPEVVSSMHLQSVSYALATLHLSSGLCSDSGNKRWESSKVNYNANAAIR